MATETRPATETQQTDGRVRPSSVGTGNSYLEFTKFVRGPLEYLSELGHGNDLGLVPFKFGNLNCHLVTKPEYIKQALHNEDWPPITRGRLARLKNWYSGGLFITSGPDHHRQRDEIWKPLFDDPRIPKAAVAHTRKHAERWREGSTIEIYHDLLRLVYGIDWEVLTGKPLDSEPGAFSALATGVEVLPWLPLPYSQRRWRSPLPHAMRGRRAKARLDAIVDAMIAERRGNGHDDLLTRIVQTSATDKEARATFMMYFGADQLHALFAWTFYLLGTNPDVEAKWHMELDQELGGKDATVDDIDRLAYTQKVLKESMRVIPPVWGFFREMYGDYKLGDEIVPDGHLMGMSPWVTHRDPRLWPDPLRFDPERWNDDAPKPPPVSYFPFSAGPYECHGKSLAWKEAVLIASTIGQQWKLRPASSKPPRPFAMWATVPQGGLEMRVDRRA